MFFNADLLSKRDSGFGLLWLAATLGSKSSFKKLPRQSIKTADIPQLCEQISRPSEPLALRLSSNLMVGVARVYKIKHEIFVTDVNNCFTLVKKTIQEIHSLSAQAEAQLIMGQPTVRPDTVTLSADPTISLALELDTFNASWDEIAELASQRRKMIDAEDEDFDPEGRKKKGKAKAKASVNPMEAARTGLHTLNEDHEHLLMSTSFEGNGSFLGLDPSSSQFGGGAGMASFAFDDNLIDGGDGLDMPLDLGIGEDLAMGEEWTALDAPPVTNAEPMQMGLDMDFGAGDTMMDVDPPFLEVDGNASDHQGRFSKSPAPASKKRTFVDSDKENQPIGEGDRGETPQSALYRRSQTPLGAGGLNDFNVVDNHPQEQRDGPALDAAAAPPPPPARKPKRVRILVDETTELTDEELKAAREKYLERQLAIRQEMERKKAEKESTKAFEDMIWGVPLGLDTPALADFWTSRYKFQVEARSGVVHLDDQVDRPSKRQKRAKEATPERLDVFMDDMHQADMGYEMNYQGAGVDFDLGGEYMQDYDAPLPQDEPNHMRSSEEPERARNVSRPPSMGFDIEALNPSSGTQRSEFFPWDNAAPTSSTNGGGYLPLASGSDRISIDKADTQIRAPRSSLLSGGGSRRSSMLPPSQAASLSGINFGASPGAFGTRGSDDFQFDVTNEAPTGTAQDTQDTDMTLVTLEKTSYNFLEYCKIQLQTLPGRQTSLSFDDIAPRTTSTRKVAAAALYHCLVLATKDLVTVRQEEPFVNIVIQIK